MKIPTFFDNLIQRDRRYFLRHSLIASLHLFLESPRQNHRAPAWNEADLDPSSRSSDRFFTRMSNWTRGADDFSRNREEDPREKFPRESRSLKHRIFQNHRSDLVPESLGIINSNRIINIPYRTTFVNQYVRNNLPRRDWRSSFKRSLVPCHKGGNK